MLTLRVGAAAAGDQVYISYGDKPSDTFASFYGFCPAPGANAHAAAELTGALSVGQLQRLGAAADGAAAAAAEAAAAQAAAAVAAVDGQEEEKRKRCESCTASCRRAQSPRRTGT